MILTRDAGAQTRIAGHAGSLATAELKTGFVLTEEKERGKESMHGANPKTLLLSGSGRILIQMLLR
ncbi:MAG: hypothetical protein V3S89_04595 [Desulfobacterales bacterium]